MFLRELLQYPAAAQDSQWRRFRAGEKAKAQAPVSSVGEERALLLGFTMVAFSVLMYFVVGIVVVKPCLNRYEEELFAQQASAGDCFLKICREILAVGQRSFSDTSMTLKA